jgi:hypothetical protein
MDIPIESDINGYQINAIWQKPHFNGLMPEMLDIF